jgi:4-diphosphocytidyl-2-C-methyl-D-erythritol kinase
MSESSLTLPSFAKINWSLRVLGRRADGFHDLETLFQTVSLHDDLAFERAGSTSLRCDDPTIPVDEANLVIRAARLMQRRGAGEVAVSLHKRIPAGGGLGGGSSNAATTLRALNQMFGLGLSIEELSAMALRLGSDVPFFLHGGTAYATGRGELLVPLPDLKAVPLLLIVPRERVNTAEAFALLGGTRIATSMPLGVGRFQTMARHDLLSHAQALTNDFESPIFTRYPHFAELKRRLYDAGAIWSSMTGSGATIVGAFRDSMDRDRALPAFSDAQSIAAETIGASGSLGLD